MPNEIVSVFIYISGSQLELIIPKLAWFKTSIETSLKSPLIKSLSYKEMDFTKNLNLSKM